MQAITWWDFSDGGWLNAPAGLLHKDYSCKPAYDELMKLVKGGWWLPPTKMTTDANGRFSFTGFLGEYEVPAGVSKNRFFLKGKRRIADFLSNY